MSWHIKYIRYEHIVSEVDFGYEKLITIFFNLPMIHILSLFSICDCGIK